MTIKCYCNLFIIYYSFAALITLKFCSELYFYTNKTSKFENQYGI